jgi:uncharacterized membrane protein (DUF106 family)
MNILALIRAALEAFAAYYKTVEIRERRALRAELKALDHEIENAVNAGDAARISELQNERAEVTADLDALRPAALPALEKGPDDPRS